MFGELSWSHRPLIPTTTPASVSIAHVTKTDTNLILTTLENTMTYHNAKILHKHCLQFVLGVKMAPRETENK